MKKIMGLLLMGALAMSAQAGFGIQVGAFSPTTGLEDNDNAVMFGVDYYAKFTVIGIKIDAFYVDSSGRYSTALDDVGNFGEATVDVEGMISADIMYYPLGTTFFLQGGLNYTSMDVSSVEISDDIIDNELGLELGAGITLFDKLLVQGKIMYTPNAIQSDAADTLKDLDENLMGYMVSVGWQF